MSVLLHLTIATPARVLFDSTEVIALRAEDASGSFGILLGHAAFLTVLAPSVLRWHAADGVEQFCAVKEGVLRVSGGHEVSIACREGVMGASGTSLEVLEAQVDAARTAPLDAVRPRSRRRNPSPYASRAPVAVLSAAERETGGRSRIVTQPPPDDIDPKRNDDDNADRMARAARQAVEHERLAQEEPEPSLGTHLGQIGILGWTIVVPTLLGLVIGHWLDRHFNTGVFFSAPLLMAGAAVGLWSAWKWMHRQTRRDRQ